MQLDLLTFYRSLLIIALIIALGFFLGRKKLISTETNRQLVNLLLSVFMPAALFTAFPSEFSGDSAQLFLLDLLAGLLVMLLVILASRLFFCKRFFKGELRYEAQFAFIFNNATFLGYPLISTAFGEQGIIPYCGFIVSFNIALFSYGIYLFQRRLSHHLLKEVLLNPNIIAVLAGMLLFLLRFQPPDFLSQSISYVAAATTPLSLICIGYMLSHADLKQLIRKWRLFIIAAIQLIFAPALTWGLLALFHFPTEVIIVCTLIQALPTATSLGLFAEKYGGNNIESSELVIISTLISVLTLPLVVFLLSTLL